MYFRLIAHIKALYLTDKKIINIQFPESGDLIDIELRRINEDEVNNFHKAGSLICTCIVELKMDEQNEIKFKEIDQMTPEEIKVKLREIEERLSRIIDSFVYNYRWQFGVENSHNPIQVKYGPSWSFDKINWHYPPAHPISLRYKFGLSMQNVNQEQIELLQSLMEKNANEPLGHELFSEAWQIKETNPRSALIIGIASLEAGFVECVSKLVPDASWLIKKVPSPPLIEMLINYLPLLPVKNMVWGKIIPPPKSIRKILQEGIENRNQIAHGRSITIKKDFDFEEFLSSVRDVLYLLDFYCGHSWAFNLISPNVGKEIIDSAKKVT